MMKADFGKIEKITKIENLTEAQKRNLKDFSGFPDLEEIDYEGYLIECLKIAYGRNFYTKIGILLESEQQCCENFGMIISDDDIKSFIGAELTEVSEIKNGDISLIPEAHRDDSETESIFFNLETDRGLLQFAVYNCHNGFYGHDCHFIISYHKERTESIKVFL